MDDTMDKLQFQQDLAEHGESPIDDFVNDLMGIRKPPEEERDPLENISMATIESAKNEEEFLKSDTISAESKMNSRIMKEFTKDEIKMLYAFALSFDFPSNNAKSDILTKYLEPKGFVCLGTGTNRVAYKKGRYVYKIALDRRGIADMINEARRSIDAPQYLAHCYECCGVMAVDEYVDIMDQATFSSTQGKAAILQVLSELSKEFIFGDMGYDAKNFGNIGTRRTSNGDSLVFLDFAYMHPRLGNEDAFSCIKDGTPLQYNSTYTKYICPKCHAEFDYRDILWRINANHSNFENNFLSDIQDNLYLDDAPDLENLAIDADI